MHEEDRKFRDLQLERSALEFLDDGMEEAAMDALAFIAGADAVSVRGY